MSEFMKKLPRLEVTPNERDSMLHILAYIYPLTNLSHEIQVVNSVSKEPYTAQPDQLQIKDGIMLLLEITSTLFCISQNEIHQKAVGGDMNEAIRDGELLIGSNDDRKPN